MTEPIFLQLHSEKFAEVKIHFYLKFLEIYIYAILRLRRVSYVKVFVRAEIVVITRRSYVFRLFLAINNNRMQAAPVTATVYNRLHNTD